MSSQSPQVVLLLIILSLINLCSVAAQGPPTPTQINNLSDYLESLFPAGVEGRVIDNNGNIEARFWFIDEDHPEVSARRIARDYIYAAYNSRISIRSAKIEIIQPTGEMGLSITLGANVASVHKDTNWVDPTTDPSTFIQWVRNISGQQPKGLGLERASLKNAINIKGPWSELTPQNSVDNKSNIVLGPQSARVKGGEAGAEASAEPTRNPLQQAGEVYKTEEGFKATRSTLQDRKPENVTHPEQTEPLNVSRPPAAGALAGWIGKGLLSGIRSFVDVVGQKAKDSKKQPQAQETAATKSAAPISATSHEPALKTTASLDAYSSSVALDDRGKPDQAVPLSGKEVSNLTSVEPDGSVTEESPAISYLGRATRSENSTAGEGSPSKRPSSSSDNTAFPKEKALTNIYRIGVGDVLDIRFNSAASTSTLYTVIDGGLIDLPVAGGAMAVAGLTVDEIQSRVASELKRRAVVDSSHVSVGVRHYASHSVVITGLVLNPGSKFLRREAVPLYVIMAEAQARPDAGRVTIIRPGSAVSTVDLRDPATLDLIIQSGDTISVTARPQEFYFIGGGIKDPGQKIFQPGITLLQAIHAAGGLKRQHETRIEISREGADGFLTTIRFKLKEIKAGKNQDPQLQPGDRIEVAY
jgi:protein involved in polysaccharide export with SLBB domain